MPSAELTLTTRKPELPKADFAFHIDFKKGEGPASRVFLATQRVSEVLDNQYEQPSLLERPDK